MRTPVSKLIGCLIFIVNRFVVVYKGFVFRFTASKKEKTGQSGSRQEVIS